MSTSTYNRLLLVVAGLGGLLYGIDVGIIAGALPYLNDTSGLNAAQLSFIVAAVLLGSVISTLFAGVLSDWMGRRQLMRWSGFLFIASIPVIALAHGYAPLVFGRLLQGLSAGFIGVVVPLYLAECLGASERGKGTGMFQWLLTLGIVVAAVVGLYFSHRVSQIADLHDAARLFAFKDEAWRRIFWVSMPPGLLFFAGTFFVAESPRWLFRRGNAEGALSALLRSRNKTQAEIELREMKEAAELESAKSGAKAVKESLLQRKYLVPFALACLILACNQTTGVNSIIAYNATVLIQAGLNDSQAHLAYVVFTVVNFLVTIAGMMLVDRKGRKFLLSVGSAGIIVALVCVGARFLKTEKLRLDYRSVVQSMVSSDQTLRLQFDEDTARKILNSDARAGSGIKSGPTSLTIIYSYGDFRAATPAIRSDDLAAKPVTIARADCVPENRVVAFFSDPFANLQTARTAPLTIDNALITPVPDARSGWITAAFLFAFMASFAIGPGVCVWLALSELMPTRIRSNGMSVALLINQAVSTFIAAIFLPTVGKYGYATVFFAFAGCTVIYFFTAAFLLPETKGKTLEEIEKYFER
ncbi:MAG TPA: MFS transporter [Candidatus Aquilonibacter sp.]|nr:MFS transporter [Candidatus Aquilonibacter sp.]